MNGKFQAYLRYHEARKKPRPPKIGQVNVPRLPKDQLIDEACEAYNRWNYHAIGVTKGRASRDSKWSFIKRICVNYLRHETTEYDKRIRAATITPGAGATTPEIKARILDAIAEAHPWLADECERQRGSWKEKKR